MYSFKRKGKNRKQSKILTDKETWLLWFFTRKDRGRNI